MKLPCVILGSDTTLVILIIMIYPSRLIDCNKCTTWWGMLKTEEAVHVRGQGKYAKSLYFLISFTVNLKLL